MKQSNQPLQYQQGYVEFYKLRFKVTEDVLIPRPETELLVDDVLQFVNTLRATREVNKQNSSQLSASNNITILDIGTGSGNIAISIAKNISHPRGVTIIATEVSKEALKIAKQNAKLHGVENRITFLESDLLDSVIPRESDGRTDRVSPKALAVAQGSVTTKSHQQIATSHSVRGKLPRNDKLVIVTNLPYIPTARIPYLDASVVDFEPHIALDGGNDGFELYRKLFAQINKKGLKPNLILGEIDYTHGDIAKNEAEKYFPDAKVEVKTDLAHKQRILHIQKP